MLHAVHGNTGSDSAQPGDQRVLRLAGGGWEAEEGSVGGLDAKAADDPECDDVRLSSLEPCIASTNFPLLDLQHGC